jgi:hypothetical protein
MASAPRALDVIEFAQARAREIQAIEQQLNSARSGGRRVVSCLLSQFAVYFAALFIYF